MERKRLENSSRKLTSKGLKQIYATAKKPRLKRHKRPFPNHSFVFFSLSAVAEN